MEQWQKLKGSEHIKRMIEVALVGNHSIALMCVGSFRDAEYLLEPVLKHLQVVYTLRHPCYCGFFGSAERVCTCTEDEIRMQQRSNMGLPHEMHADLPRINYEKLTSKRTPEPLEDALKRVERAKLNLATIRLDLDGASLSLMNAAIKQLDFDQWQYDTTIKVARSIAALRHSTEVIDSIAPEDLAEAIQYRAKF